MARVSDEFACICSPEGTDFAIDLRVDGADAFRHESNVAPKRVGDDAEVTLQVGALCFDLRSQVGDLRPHLRSQVGEARS